MLYPVLKALISGVLIATVSEVSRRSPTFGGLIASLPLISVLAVIWLWRDTQDVDRIAGHMQSTFWFVLPSLPMFLVMPLLLRSGVSFYGALALSCAMTLVLYAAMTWLLKLFGVEM